MAKTNVKFDLSLIPPENLQAVLAEVRKIPDGDKLVAEFEAKIAEQKVKEAQSELRNFYRASGKMLESLLTLEKQEVSFSLKKEALVQAIKEVEEFAKKGDIQLVDKRGKKPKEEKAVMEKGKPISETMPDLFK